ncbi:hypothetical protein [Streptomyces sp. NPDC087317]|uniref:hypothetical protein n=1 Tax=Streptomyces sp. NPDC087317 TaxID=3365784 RepID=UPI0038150914
MTSHVENEIAARIARVRAETERKRQQRAGLATARTAGLARRHAQKLYRQANRPTEETTVPAAIRSALCPSCRQERPARLLMTINISGSPHDLLKCGESACELLWCVRADRPRTAAA